MVITFANSKGGCGKTTSCIYTAEYFTRELGLRVLIVDLDHQANASSYYLDVDSIEESNILTVLEKKNAHKKVIRKINDKLDMIPGSLRLTRYDQIFAEASGKELLLSSKLAPALPDYDVVLIDTHPDMATPQKSALLMSDCIICPVVLGDRWNLDGLDLLMSEIHELKDSPLSSFCKIAKTYVLPTMAIFSGKDREGKKVIETNFNECEILPAIRYHKGTKHLLSDRTFKANALYKDYKKAMEGIWTTSAEA